MSADPRFDEIRGAIENGRPARLNSGGPTMTIKEIHDDGIIETVWFTVGGEIRRDAFHHLELTFPGSRIVSLERPRQMTEHGWMSV